MCKAKRILVCPLDWGLGHAARCIPIIRRLCEKGHTVYIASSGHQMAVLKSEFPGIEFIDFPGYHITYPRKGNMIWHIVFNLPKIFWRIFREHYKLGKLIRIYNIDTVISDNRFGLSNKKVNCIYITHQIMIKCPPEIKFMERTLYLIHKRYIRRYNECWIPDVPGIENISGDLSHKYPVPGNARFIGWLSRFNDITETEITTEALNEYDLLAILSGPEPQRSIFENILMDSFRYSNLRVCLVRGTPGNNYSLPVPANINIVDFASTGKMLSLLNNSKHIVCRPGYSTLMDLYALRENAILVPTPGQTEQEYLAAYLSERNLFYHCDQNEFNLNDAISGYQKFPGFKLGFCEGFFFSLLSKF